MVAVPRMPKPNGTRYRGSGIKKMGLEWLVKIHHDKDLVLMDGLIRPNSISTRIVHKVDDG